MARLVSSTLLILGLITAMQLFGCSKPATPPGQGSATVMTGEEASADDPAAEIAKAMAELPEAERPIAMAQKICPVGGGPLGSMGMPYKVTVKGRDVYLCCKGCKESIEKDPDMYLAKLAEPAK